MWSYQLPILRQVRSMAKTVSMSWTYQHIHRLWRPYYAIQWHATMFQTDFQYFGAKTTERLRGNSTIWSWISRLNYDQHFADYVKSTNDYRDQHQQQEVDQPEWQEIDDNMDRPQRRQRIAQPGQQDEGGRHHWMSAQHEAPT